MCEHEYVALIPARELKQLRALLRRIHQQRGWSTQLTSLDAAWESALSEAQAPGVHGATMALGREI